MIRRRILTGVIAAPFVARLGLLMPVRPVLASGWVIDFENLRPILEVKWREIPHYSSPHFGTYLERLMAKASRVCAVPPEMLAGALSNDPRLPLSRINLRAETEIAGDMDRLHGDGRGPDRV